MKILITSWFQKWLKKVNIDKDDLFSSAEFINENDETAANLGSGLYKIRIKRKYQGKRGGYRTLLILKKDKLLLFVYGFAKNER